MDWMLFSYKYDYCDKYDWDCWPPDPKIPSWMRGAKHIPFFYQFDRKPQRAPRRMRR